MGNVLALGKRGKGKGKMTDDRWPVYIFGTR